MKRVVDEIVDQMERLPVVRDCYAKWLKLQGQVDGYYHDGEHRQPKLSEQKEFRQIKNEVIRTAMKLHTFTFEDDTTHKIDEPDPEDNVSWVYWDLREIIRDNDAELLERGAAVEELTALAETGDVHAQYFLGKLYRDGNPVIPDSIKAEHWLSAAAE